MTEIVEKLAKHEANINELCRYKDTLSTSGGTIDRLWGAMETKIGKGMLITFAILLLSLLTTLYGLSYTTQAQTQQDIRHIQTDVAVIKEQINNLYGNTIKH